MPETGFKYLIDADQVKLSKDDYIGRGSYGKVYKVYTTKYGASAAKIFHITGTTSSQANILELIKKEADILARVNHEHILRFQALCYWSSVVAVIMQYEVNKSLHDLLEQKNKVTTFPYKLRFRMAYEISQALVFLHNCGLENRTIHGDIKSSNILLNGDLRVRVADFGTTYIGTRTFDPSQHARTATAIVHSVVFTAPEFLRDIYISRTSAMDVFSFGRLLFQILSRCIPYEDQRHNNLSSAIINGAEPNYSFVKDARRPLVENVDEDLELFDLLDKYMCKCCLPDPARRPSMVRIEKVMKDKLDYIPGVSLLKSATLVLNQMDLPPRESAKSTRVRLSRYCWQE